MATWLVLALGAAPFRTECPYFAGYFAGQHNDAEVYGELAGADLEAFRDGQHDAREVRAAWFEAPPETIFSF